MMMCPGWRLWPESMLGINTRMPLCLIVCSWGHRGGLIGEQHNITFVRKITSATVRNSPALICSACLQGPIQDVFIPVNL